MAKTAASWSLQTRVQFIVFLALCIGLAVGTVSMYKAAVVQDDKLTDQRVEQLAKTILKRLAEQLEKQDRSENYTRVHNASRYFATDEHRYQVWVDRGAKLLASHRSPISRSYLPVDYVGYREVLINGIHYCAFSVATADRSLIVQVAEPTPSRMIPFGWLTSEFLKFALIPFSTILLFNSLLLKRFFRPIEAVANDLNLRSPTDAKQIPIGRLPQEITPLVQSLNAHLHRMDQALATESRFTSVAAHELKTPLAGIRAQAQLASQADNPRELQQALHGVMRGVDASSRVVDQLIDLHHLDSLGDPHAWQSQITNLTRIREQAQAEFQPRADAKGIKLKMVFDINQMHGFEFAIWTMLRNLIGNAINYTPEGGKVEVRIKQRDLRIVMSVDDSGPGIAPQNRERSLKKFDRLGRHGSDGVGLGLSIVANVATTHQALLELEDSLLGGLRVVVQFHCTAVFEESGQDPAFYITAAGSWSSAGRP